MFVAIIDCFRGGVAYLLGDAPAIENFGGSMLLEIVVRREHALRGCERRV